MTPILEQSNLQESAEYTLVKEAIAQGRHYDLFRNDSFRERKMVENFIREYNAVGGSIMGIYGSAHLSAAGGVMLGQLQAHYGDLFSVEDLSHLALLTEPLGEDVIELGGQSFRALCFGEQDLSGWSAVYVSRTFWRLEGAYDLVQNWPAVSNVLPEDNYPMAVEPGQVFMIDYTLRDGSTQRQFFRHDGGEWNGRPTTVQVTPVIP